MENQNDILFKRGVSEIIGREDLDKKLAEDKVLRVKFGTDPTSPYLHLGRSIPLLKLRDFQNAGHQVVLIIGDFTGTVGDTSDKESERPMLTSDQVVDNMRTYLEQAGKIIDIEKAEIRYNSEWLKDLSFGKVSQLADVFSINEFISRDLINRRLESGSRVSLREVLYPIMQGYDSLVLDADVEIGGNDQRFNMLAGRSIQKHFDKSPQSIFTNNLINGTDGKKMSSSQGNTIKLLDTPRDMFGKIMSVVDDLIIEYFTMLTRVPMSEIEKYKSMLDGGANPRDVKMILAKTITAMYHGEKEANDAMDFFVSTFTNKEIPEDIADLKPSSYNIIDILIEAGFAESKGEARRLLEGDGIKVGGETINDPETIVPTQTIVQKGKRFFVKIV